MNLVRRRILVVFLCGACGLGRASEGVPVRIELEAFSVATPADSGWKREVSSGRVSFGRSLDSVMHTFTLEAREYPLAPVPVESVSDMLIGMRLAAEKEARLNGRYQLLTHSEEIATRQELKCVEYRKTWKDHGGEATQKQELAMSANGVLCIHPEHPERVIEVSYSVRNATGVFPLDAKRDGEAFINSLQARLIRHGKK